jgi:glycosyltransferase involved in cell wall biosynthesis
MSTPERTPRVSVVMAAYKAAPYIGDALASLRRQTFRDFEAIVVDDGSPDGTGEAARAAVAGDARFTVIRQDNAGAASALNRALALARGEFAANADADDFYLPHRLERLVAEFDKNPDLGICGGAVEHWTGGEATGQTLGQPLADADIRSGMVFGCMFYHPTVMYRRRLMVGDGNGYDAWYRMAYDYDLWVRHMPGTRLANVDAVLTRYRQHGGQLTQTESRNQRAEAEFLAVWKKVVGQTFELPFDQTDFPAHGRLAMWPQSVTAAERDASGAWLERLWRANRRLRRLPVKAFDAQACKRWHWACSHASDTPAGALRAWLRSPLTWLGGPTLVNRLGVLRRCMKARPASA